MHLEEDDANDLKSWVVVRLKDISDADSDVLADYVLALIRTDTPLPQLKLDVLESLEDFLKENTTDFVNEIFETLHNRSYKSGYIPPLHDHQVPTAALQVPRQGPIGQPSQRPKESRKRSYNDAGLDGPNSNSQYPLRENRQTKQMRGRGGRGGRGNGFEPQRVGFQQSNGHGGKLAGMPNGFPAMPNLSDMPPFDPNDPMAAIMAMQAMGLPPLPGMEGLLPGQIGAQRQHEFDRNGAKGVCRDYVNKGYCTRGENCQYQHTNPVVMPGQEDEYDPKDSLITSGPFSPISLASRNHLNNQSSLEGFTYESKRGGRGSDRGRGRGRGGSDRGGFHKPNRAEFSHAGPNHDRAITTIVIEQIPEEKFSEEAVREFFSTFGIIEEVTMQPYKRLAIVKYSDYSSARAAYDSPKVIFDNRFVKVYWYKPGSLPTPSTGQPTLSASAHNANDTTMKESSPAIDMEAFTAAATAAQAKLDAKKAALAASQSQREALERQKAELAAKQAAEKQKLLDRLAAKGELPKGTSNGASTASTPAPDNSTNVNSATTPKVGDNAHTLMLRAKVAELEAEAKSLGLPDSALSSDPSLSTFSPRGRGRGRGRGARGSYRGWEAFDPSSSSYRGGRGGGSPFVPARGGGGGKYNLDLRTKRVAVTLRASTDAETDGSRRWTAERDEALRQHLLGVGEFEDIVPLAEKEAGTASDKSPSPETLVVVFNDRGTAEGFFYGVKGKEVPGLGKVGISWFNGPVLKTDGKAGGHAGDADANADVDMGNGLDSGLGHWREGGDEKRVDGISNANENGNGTVVTELRGPGQGEVGGLGEGDYDVAEEDDDSWMT